MYTIARAILKIAKWLWPVVLIPLIAAAITTLVPLFVQPQPGSPLIVFLTPGPVRTTTILISSIVLGILVLAPFAAWLILLTEGHTIGNKVLRQYLHAVEEAHQGLNPKGFAQQSALISVNVPLDTIFIYLNAVKSTTMRWLALQMARSSLSRGYELPEGLALRQIPVLNDHSTPLFSSHFYDKI